MKCGDYASGNGAIGAKPLDAGTRVRADVRG
jgi:hypothetical protein